MDLDNFKQINDMLGHMNGDMILKETAELLREIFEKDSYITRFGGDEFCAFITDTDEKDALYKIVRLKEGIQKEYRKGDQSIMLSISIGCVYIKNGEHTYTQVIEKADEALYQAKKRGKNQYYIINI
jgi:diguanylate cyclase (GGDEF)-like protein